jgi:D-alanyl-D-alanine endopeptidase (penicillin-binding protein 7)
MMIRHTRKLITSALFSRLASALLLAASLNAAAATGTYTVKPGDTLWRIASTTGISVEQLRQYNRIKGNTLQSGQVLTLSPLHSTASKTALAAVKKVPPKAVSTASKSTIASSKTASTKTISTKTTSTAATSKLAKKSAASASRTPLLLSSSAIVVDAATGQTLYSKNTGSQMPIASITKLMTAMVALDANPAMNETLSISDADIDNLKHTTSRLPVGTKLTRHEMLRLALMSSENRAASALSRHYPGGRPAFISAMRNKAAKLGMSETRFSDPTGLAPSNVSTAEDLVKLVKASNQYPLIHEFTTTQGREVAISPKRQPLEYKNTNRLVRAGDWDIAISKTGYINEAGHCLVMLATVANRPAVMVFLEAQGKLSAQGDASRVKNWMEAGGAEAQQLAMAAR